MLYRRSSSPCGKDVEIKHRNSFVSEDQGVYGQPLKPGGGFLLTGRSTTLWPSPMIRRNQIPLTAAMNVKGDFPVVKPPEENTAQWT